MKLEIRSAIKGDHETLIDIWESSVRDTHDFLRECDIYFFRSLIIEHYFNNINIMLATNNSGRILGFCGVHERNIEMLFISPESRGLGIGSLLLEYAVNNQGAVKVDVNEQNVQALGFYEHLGFNVVGRSPLDGYGKPYPLLHMELKNLIAPTRRGRIG